MSPKDPWVKDLVSSLALSGAAQVLSSTARFLDNWNCVIKEGVGVLMEGCPSSNPVKYCFQLCQVTDFTYGCLHKQGLLKWLLAVLTRVLSLCTGPALQD